MSFAFWSKRAPSPPSVCDLRVFVTWEGRPVKGATVSVGTSSAGAAKATAADGVAAFSLAPTVRASVLVTADGYGQYAGDYRLFAGSQTVPIGLQRRPHTNRPLEGHVFVTDRTFHDQSGPRRILLCSSFPMFRMCEDNMEAGASTADDIAKAGYQGSRCFHTFGAYAQKQGDQGAAGDIFYQREVGYQTALKMVRPVGKLFADRGLGFYLSGDWNRDAWNRDDASYLSFIRDYCQEWQASGYADRIIAWDCFNEIFHDDSLHELAPKVIDIVRRELSPAPLIGQGSRNDESPIDLDRSSVDSDICIIHGTSAPPATAWKRAHTLINGFADAGGQNIWRGYPKPFVQGEPASDGAGGSHPIDGPFWALVGLYWQHQVTGQASVYFGGASVRMDRPLTSDEGFNLIPAFSQTIPEDIGTYNRTSIGGEYEKDGKFVSLDLPGFGWRPLRPAESWTITNADGGKGSGTGPIPARTNEIARLLVGRYA